jgi:hypothetical protein
MFSHIYMLNIVHIINTMCVFHKLSYIIFDVCYSFPVFVHLKEKHINPVNSSQIRKTGLLWKWDQQLRNEHTVFRTHNSWFASSIAILPPNLLQPPVFFERNPGWWFQTCFIFHNIWDNPSYWLSYFSRWLKPPTRIHSNPYFVYWTFSISAPLGWMESQIQWHPKCVRHFG